MLNLSKKKKDLRALFLTLVGAAPGQYMPVNEVVQSQCTFVIHFVTRTPLVFLPLRRPVIKPELSVNHVFEARLSDLVINSRTYFLLQAEYFTKKTMLAAHGRFALKINGNDDSST